MKKRKFLGTKVIWPSDFWIKGLMKHDLGSKNFSNHAHNVCKEDMSGATLVDLFASWGHIDLMLQSCVDTASKERSYDKCRRYKRYKTHVFMYQNLR